MPEQWKAICKVKDIPLHGVHMVPRGLAWQELPRVEVIRDDRDHVLALLEGNSAKCFTVKLEDGKVYLDLNELNAPASKAEAALAGAFAVVPRV